MGKETLKKKKTKKEKKGVRERKVYGFLRAPLFFLKKVGLGVEN